MAPYFSYTAPSRIRFARTALSSIRPHAARTSRPTPFAFAWSITSIVFTALLSSSVARSMAWTSIPACRRPLVQSTIASRRSLALTPGIGVRISGRGAVVEAVPRLTTRDYAEAAWLIRAVAGSFRYNRDTRRTETTRLDPEPTPHVRSRIQRKIAGQICCQAARLAMIRV